jgi:ribosomal protein L11 methyltransferase
MYTLTCKITAGQLELASGIGYACGMAGCVEEAFGQYINMTFYFEREGDAGSAAAAFAEMLGTNAPSVEYIDGKQDWNAAWRESMEPAQIAEGVWVSPAWLPPPENGRKAWIKIEPKMAFGTGHHETTRLAARALIERADFVAGKSALDIGTGSGVLCFVANYLGARAALGVEIDKDCLENLAENLRDNPPGPSGSVRFAIGTLDAVGINDNCFDAVIMNMLSTESTPLLKQIASIINNNSLLIWSGILIDECEEVINIAKIFGFALSSAQTENEWWCGIFERLRP